MADTDHLHRLIHAMSRAEKRYFKLFASRYRRAGNTVNELLFDAIAAMPEYDVDRLVAQFPDAAFMRRLPVTKRRLYEAVLDSLDAFHGGSTVDDRIRAQLHHVEVLHAKALYTDAAKILHAAQKLAQAHERHALLLQIAEWERRFMERSNYASTTADELDQRAGRVRGVAAAWDELDGLWQVKSRAFMLLYSAGQAPGPEELARMEELAKHPLLAPKAVQHSVRARYLYHHVHSALAYAHNQLAACEEHLESCMAVLVEGENVFKGEAQLMLGVLGNLAHVRMRRGKHAEALEGFREFRRVPLRMAEKPSADLEMKLFVMGTSLQFTARCAQGRFAEAYGDIGELDEGLRRYERQLSPLRRSELLLQGAYACLGAGHPDRALRWCNRLLNEKGIQEHAELHALGRMLNVMCLVELRKQGLLEYVERNTLRLFGKNGAPYMLERVLLEHAQALAAAKAKEPHDRWALLLADLESVAREGREAVALDRVDLVAWARAKVEGRSMADSVAEQWKRRKAPAVVAKKKHASPRKPHTTRHGVGAGFPAQEDQTQGRRVA